MTAYAKAVRKYLDGRAEPEAAWAGDVDGAWSHVLAVPARRETAAFLDGAADAARSADGSVLVLVVVNGPVGDAGTAAGNDLLLREIRARWRTVLTLPDGSFLGRGDPFDVLVVDRARPGREFAPRDGVGLARKIGGDLALALRERGLIASPWIHFSDGDATQPADRFSARHSADPEPVAWHHPFVHEAHGDPAIDRAIRLYDLSLRYYVEGLCWAGSPWAFPTIGSTLTVRADAYAAVRGFPRREAGEDFYLMNKLAKIGAVREAGSGPVRLAGRTSRRVPFGTGAGIARILAAQRRREPFTLYHPSGFRVLAAWEAALGRETPLAPHPADDLPAREARALRTALRATGAGSEPASLPVAHRRDRFDAFKTLKFLHAVRDDGFPKIPWERALDRAAAMGMRSPAGAR